MEGLGDKIRARRTKLGLTQQDLADRCNFKSSQIVSQIEKGEREIKAWELNKISSFLKMEMNEFFGDESLADTPSVLWRAKPGDNPDMVEAEFVQLCKRYRHVEKLLGIKPPCKLPEVKDVDWKNFSFEDMDTFIDTNVAPFLKLGSRPAFSIINVLENRCGVKVFFKEMEEGSAASFLSDFGPAILMNSNEVPWRWNYSFAHELFHLITWKSNPPLENDSSELLERIHTLADIFASNLLLPEHELRGEFKAKLSDGKISYIDAVQLARDFDVSVDALLWRLVNLKLLKKDSVKMALANPELKRLFKSSAADNKKHKQKKLPSRFVTLAFTAYVKGKISRTRLAEYLDVSLFDLEEFLAEYEIDAEAEYEAEIGVA